MKSSSRIFPSNVNFKTTREIGIVIDFVVNQIQQNFLEKVKFDLIRLAQKVENKLTVKMSEFLEHRSIVLKTDFG
jgi:hypothetical protein